MISLTVAILLGEVAVRLMWPQNLSGMWRYEDERGLKVHLRNHTVSHQFRDRSVRYEFDEHGLRASRDRETGIRILCLGESFTFGWLLHEEDTFVGRLQRSVDGEFGKGRFCLLNGGHGGWGTGDYVQYVERYGEQLGPDAIVVFLNVADIGRSLKTPRYELTGAEGFDLRKLTTRRSRWGRKRSLTLAFPGWNWLLQHSHLVQFCRSSLRSIGESPSPNRGNPLTFLECAADTDPGVAARTGRALFRRLRDWSKTHDCALLVLTTGLHHRLGKPSPDDRQPTLAFLGDAAAAFAEDGVRFHDCSEQFHEAVRGSYESVVIPSEGHFNEKGAALVADLNWPSLRDFLQELAARKN